MFCRQVANNSLQICSCNIWLQRLRLRRLILCPRRQRLIQYFLWAILISKTGTFSVEVLEEMVRLSLGLITGGEIFILSAAHGISAKRTSSKIFRLSTSLNYVRLMAQMVTPMVSSSIPLYQLMHMG